MERCPPDPPTEPPWLKVYVVSEQSSCGERLLSCPFCELGPRFDDLSTLVPHVRRVHLIIRYALTPPPYSAVDKLIARRLSGPCSKGLTVALSLAQNSSSDLLLCPFCTERSDFTEKMVGHVVETHAEFVVTGPGQARFGLPFDHRVMRGEHLAPKT